MQQNKYSPWTYNTETKTATDITITPVSTNYEENPELVLQKTKHVATEIQPMDIHQRNNNRYYT